MLAGDVSEGDTVTVDKGPNGISFKKKQLRAATA